MSAIFLAWHGTYGAITHAHVAYAIFLPHHHIRRIFLVRFPKYRHKIYRHMRRVHIHKRKHLRHNKFVTFMVQSNFNNFIAVNCMENIFLVSVDVDDDYVIYSVYLYTTLCVREMWMWALYQHITNWPP